MIRPDVDLNQLLEQPIPPIHHDPRTTTYAHECHPLIWADCAGCHQPYSLCAQVTDEALGQIMDGVWRCWPCVLEVGR